MNAMEACAALVLGKKVRDVDWDNDSYRQFVDGKLVNERGRSASIDIDQGYSYEEYDERKKKKPIND